MRRFFVSADAVREGRIFLESAGDVRHIKDVLRMKPGDKLTLCDGTDREYDGIIDEIGEVICVSIADIKCAAEPHTKITLYQCIPKQGKMETIIQKSTELGVCRFVPVFSARSVPKPKNIETKISRWQRVAEAASKQSGRSIIPKVDAPLTVPDAAETFAEYDMVIFPYENESGITIKNTLRDFLPQGGRQGVESVSGQKGTVHASCESVRIAIIIGPEGGFTEAEASEIEGAGAKPCSLGRTILRTETAGPAAVAMVLYELEL